MSSTVSRKPPTLAELRARRAEILEVAARRGASNIRVFGSVARGESDSRDLDLLVDLERGRSLLDLAGLHLDLQDLLGCEVDVGTQIKPRLRGLVEAEAVPLLSRDEEVWQVVERDLTELERQVRAILDEFA